MVDDQFIKRFADIYFDISAAKNGEVLYRFFKIIKTVCCIKKTKLFRKRCSYGKDGATF
jgi:hypothetical protein